MPLLFEFDWLLTHYTLLFDKTLCRLINVYHFTVSVIYTISKSGAKNA